MNNNRTREKQGTLIGFTKQASGTTDERSYGGWIITSCRAEVLKLCALNSDFIDFREQRFYSSRPADLRLPSRGIMSTMAFIAWASFESTAFSSQGWACVERCRIHRCSFHKCFGVINAAIPSVFCVFCCNNFDQDNFNSWSARPLYFSTLSSLASQASFPLSPSKCFCRPWSLDSSLLPSNLSPVFSKYVFTECRASWAHRWHISPIAPPQALYQVSNITTVIRELIPIPGVCHSFTYSSVNTLYIYPNTRSQYLGQRDRSVIAVLRLLTSFRSSDSISCTFHRTPEADPHCSALSYRYHPAW